jgi:hypothetical protein
MISINRIPSFTEVWHEGSIDFNEETYRFWIVCPQGVDSHWYEYEVEVRWFFKRVPKEVRAMMPIIIEAFKQTNE